MMDIIDKIKKLEHFKTFPCTKCNTPIRSHTLQIYATCPECRLEHKTRGYASIGSEIQDVIDAVLEWMGKDETFDAVMKRYKEMQEHLAINHGRDLK